MSNLKVEGGVFTPKQVSELPVVKLSNAILSHCELTASEFVHCAGWALSPMYTKKADLDIVSRAKLGMAYIEGRVQLEKAEFVTDMITGKPLFMTDDVILGDTRVVRKLEPFYGIADLKLRNGLENEPIRSGLEENGVKLRGLAGLGMMRCGRDEYQHLRDCIKPAVLAVEEISRSLVIGQVTQERTLGKHLQGTTLAHIFSLESRKRLTIEGVEMVANKLVSETERLYKLGFGPLAPITSIKEAKRIVGLPQARWSIGEIAQKEARKLHKMRFWLAFALTQGELYTRITQVTPELMEVAAALEKAAEPMNLIGFYDHFDYQGGDDRLDYSHEVYGETEEAAIAQVRQLKQEEMQSSLAGIMEELASMMQSNGDGDEPWDEESVTFSTGSTCFEDVMAGGLIPVSYNRAAGVESKISKLKAQKAVLEDMASLIGVRADDIEWVIEQSDFDLLTQKEEARKLMLPTQAERDSDDTSWVNPTRAKIEVSRASDLLSKGKKYF